MFELGEPLLFGRHHGPSRDFAAIRQRYQTALAAGGQAGRFAPAPQPTPSDLALGQARVVTALDQAVAAGRPRRRPGPKRRSTG